MTSRSKTLDGFTLLVSGRIGNAFISIISTAILARLLSPNDFGVVSAALLVVALANVIFDGAFGISLVKNSALTEADQRTSLTVALLVSFVLAGLVIVFSPSIETFFRSDAVGDLIAIAALTIPFKAIFAVSSAMLQRAGRFGSIAAGTLVGQLAGNVAVAVPMAFYGMGPWALVVGIMVSGAVEACYVAFRSRVSFYPQLERHALRDLAGSSLFSAANVMNWVANAGANAVVGRSMGFHDLGIYSRGWKLLDLVVGITATPLSRVLLPAFSSRRDDPTRLSGALHQALHIAVPAYACLSAFLVSQAPIIVYLALGPQWGQTTIVAQLFFAALVPRCAFKISENFAVAVGRSGAALIRQFIYATLMVSGAVIGLQYGVSGVALMTSCAVTLFYIMSLGFALRIGKLSPLPVIWIHLKAGILAAIVGVADVSFVWLFPDWGLFLSHLAGAASGLVVLVVLLSVAPTFWLGPAGDLYVPTIRSALNKFKFA